MSAAQFSEFGHIIESQSCCLLVFEILGDATYTADHSTEIKKFMLDEMF